MQLAAYSLGRLEEYDLSANWVYRQRKWIKFIDDPMFTITLEFRVKKLIFPEPGEYLFALTFDGKPITERRMSIQKGL